MSALPATALVLRSPVSGRELEHAEPHVLTDGEERWPVVDGIPFLRAGRDELRDEVLAALDEGDAATARCMLLRDQDDWARGGPPSMDACRVLVQDEGLSLRAAMELLRFGPVGDYFAHRWSDPTFLSGLALLGAHAADAAFVLEVGCGIGHFLRALAQRDRHAVGADVVWSKLWLARRYVAPDATLLCFDAARPWPVADTFADVAFCHDALYFMEDQRHVAAELERTGRVVLVGHTHTPAETLSRGNPRTPDAYAALFRRPAAVYDDAELTAALIEDRLPVADPRTSARAVALAVGAGPAQVPSAFALPPHGASLRINPLLDPATGFLRFPSDRYREEYGPLMERYLGREALVRRRVLVDLPEAW